MESAGIPSARPTLSGRVHFGPPRGYPGVTSPTVIPHSLLVFFPSRCLLPLNLLCFAKFRLGVFLSKEGFRGKAFPFSRSILCLCCLSLFKMDLGKVLRSAELFLNSPNHPLNEGSTRRII